MKADRETTKAGVGAAMLLCFGTLLASRAPAQEQPEDAWQFRATVYVYLPSISGSTAFPAGGTDINVSTHQIISTLKFAFMGAFEARKGPWGAYTDLMYLNAGGSKSGTRALSIPGVQLPIGATADASLDIHSLVWTMAGEFRAISTQEASVDVLAGVRLLHLKENFDFSFSTDVGPFVGAGRRGSSEQSSDDWDGIVGLKGRIIGGVSRKFFIPYYVDVGTGNSRLTWQAIGGLGYAFGWGDVIATWRYLDYDFKSGRVIQSIRLSGPVIAASFRW
jgi:hypothetical protein